MIQKSLRDKSLLIGNYRYEEMQVFSLREAVTLTSPYTPEEDEIVTLPEDVTITLDSVAVTYTAGDKIGLVKDLTYTLSPSTINTHKN